MNKTQEMVNWDVVETVCENLMAGAFLTTAKEKVNTMIIGWGQCGFMWAKKIFVVPVRKTRFTHQQLALGDEFTISMPEASMKEAVVFCGKESGRNHEDKLQACGLKTQPGRIVNVPIIEGCTMHVECRVLGQFEMDAKQLGAEEKERWYSGPGENQDNMHTLYYGEILAAYSAK